ncbi:sucrose-6-phosphate hydrolase [Nitratireductor alexandrii]|uniref:sucrose-6-phosphate hydrolase n=1 Tax=Nitratireductor alexandrii TaxID=2448161 RepID=UPI000FD8711C|nr:sucrose-6-phosphate hydrolase [Nitratireductor alexandrii]
MAKPYELEISRLEETFRWACAADIRGLERAVKLAGLSPLAAVGSGGSLTAAQALVTLHQSYTGKPGIVQTPLEAVDTVFEAAVSQWLLSAGGSNVDINVAAKSLIEREHRQIAVMCGRANSPITAICERHPFVDLLVFPPPAGKDGFLATNSLLAFSTLLARAYVSVFDNLASWDDVSDVVAPLLDASSEPVRIWRAAADTLWQRSTTIVLYGPSTKVGAIDIESKFTEAALGNIQLADYRNFAHGRHHWLAKCEDQTAVLALVAGEDRELANKTLKLVPVEVPIASLDIPGAGPAALLGSLLAALRITGWAGQAREIDPGQPGVPEFGRRLYHLKLPKREYRDTAPQVNATAAAAIRRKTGESVHFLQEKNTLRFWEKAHADFVDRLEKKNFGAVVLDYDGTVVDTRERFDPARPDIAGELQRIADSDAILAIATGRGVSVRNDLRAVLPDAVWDRVVVGYYNGAMIGSLADDAQPDGTDEVCPELKDLADALAESNELSGSARQTNRRYQITLEPMRFMAENRLWDIARACRKFSWLTAC